MAKRRQTSLMSALTPKADTPQFIRSRGGANHKRSRWCSGLIVCGGLLRFEFFHRGVEIGRAVMRATDRFDMTAVAERAAVEQASLHDDVVHVVDELGPAIPTRLNIAGGTDVVVGARNMRAVRCPALGDVGRHLVATLFQQREELLKLA